MSSEEQPIDHTIIEANLHRYIDHTCLKPDARPDDIIRLIDEAKRHGFKAVCINSSYIEFANKTMMDGSEELEEDLGQKAAHCEEEPLLLCATVGFPLGACMTEVKVEEARRCISAGAGEIDMVVNIGNVKAGDWTAVEEDIRLVYNTCCSVCDGTASPIPLKVIFETCLLTKEEIRKLCEVCADIGVAFVKTSTGFSTGGATVADVRLMREVVGGTCGVKASGGVRDRATALAMIRAGATRLGTSSGVAIVNGGKSSDAY